MTTSLDSTRASMPLGVATTVLDEAVAAAGCGEDEEGAQDSKGAGAGSFRRFMGMRRRGRSRALVRE